MEVFKQLPQEKPNIDEKRNCTYEKRPNTYEKRPMFWKRDLCFMSESAHLKRNRI